MSMSEAICYDIVCHYYHLLACPSYVYARGVSAQGLSGILFGV